MADAIDSGKLWSEAELKASFARSKDVIIHSYRFDEDISSEVVLIYDDGLCDTGKISDVIMPELRKMYVNHIFPQEGREHYIGMLPLSPVKPGASIELLSEWLFEGTLLLLFSESKKLFRMSISKPPIRFPEQSSTEATIKGPKDGFVEDIAVNAALIRKRLRTNSLCYEHFIIGKRSKTRVGLMYIDDIIAPKLLEEIKRKLRKINIDALSTTDQIKDLIADHKYALFPLLDYTGRPDKAVHSLLAGRFIIIIDGSPMVVIGPATLMLLLKSPEDDSFSFYYVSFIRFLRLLSLTISIFLPAVWVALSAYHQDQIPYRLLATIASSRHGLPFPSQLEMLLLLILLEFLREAGFRVPSNVGSTLTVIGGIIIGDASIKAGLVSPSVVVVGAISVVCGVTLVNQSLNATVTLLRFLLFFMSCFLGIIGILLGLMLLVFYMSTLRSFGVAYLSPLSPIIFKDVLNSVLRFPWINFTSRPVEVSPQDSTAAQGADNNSDDNKK